MKLKSSLADNFESEGNLSEIIVEEFSKMEFFVKEIFLGLDSINLNDTSERQLLKNFGDRYFKTIEECYGFASIMPSSFLFDDKNSLRNMLSSNEIEGNEKISDFFSEVIYNSNYMMPIHVVLGRQTLSDNQNKRIIQLIQSFMHDFSFLKEQSDKVGEKTSLENDIYNKKFSSDKVFLNGVISARYDDPVFQDGSFLLDKKRNQNETLTSYEEHFLSLLFAKWYNGINIKKFETSLDRENLDVEKDAKLLSKESLKNGSYLWLLSRLLQSKYVYDENFGEKKGRKGLTIRMGGKMMNFVKSTSKKGKEIIASGGKKKTMKLIGRLARNEKIKLEKFYKGSIMPESDRLQGVKAMNSLDDIGHACNQGKRSGMISLLGNYSKIVSALNKSIGLKLTTDIGLKGNAYMSEKFKSGLVKIEKAKTSLLAIEKQIENIKNALQKKLQRLNILARHNPAKAEELRKKAIEINNRENVIIIKKQKKGVSLLAQLDDQTIKSLSGKKGFVRNYLKRNNMIKKLEANKYMKGAGLTRKGLVGRGVVSLMIYGGLQNSGESEMMKKFAVDIGDAGVGFIPVVGGINDLVVFVRGKDWNDRDLTPKEMGERLGFGIVGLIPGVGWIIKIGKGSKKVKNARSLLKAHQAFQKISKIAYKSSNTYALGSLGLYGAVGMAQFVGGMGQATGYAVGAGLDRLDGEEELPPIPETHEEITEAPVGVLLDKLQNIHYSLLKNGNLSLEEKLRSFEKSYKVLLQNSSESITVDLPEIEQIFSLRVEELKINHHYSNETSNYDSKVNDISSIRILKDGTRMELTKSTLPLNSMHTQSYVYGDVSDGGPSLIYNEKIIRQLVLPYKDPLIQEYVDTNIKFLNDKIDSERSQRNVYGFSIEPESIDGIIIEGYSLVEKNKKSYLSFDIFDKGKIVQLTVPLAYFSFDSGIIDLESMNSKHYISKLLIEHLASS